MIKQQVLIPTFLSILILFKNGNWQEIETWTIPNKGPKGEKENVIASCLSSVAYLSHSFLLRRDTISEASAHP